ncbi:MAG: energy-coupling factor transporter ATPase [Bacilli bacterium]|jgi:energy-coupling factor transport system ATP-binding protein|nr:energy-coupling factor transporter ATPase [Bacilli bacterium]
MAIKIENVFYTYAPQSVFEYKALKGIDLKINNNSFTAIIGQTGSGKSTLIQHLNAILLPEAGTLEINDFKITNKDKKTSYKNLRKEVGLVFQFSEYQLFEETILKDVMFGPLNFDVDEKRAQELAIKYLKLVNIDESLFDKSPFDLSGGQKRRVAIAGILAIQPDIIVLDEPTAGLDPQGAQEMMEVFLELKEQHHKTLILVSHDMDFVYEYAQNIVLLNEGRIVLNEDKVNFFNNKDISKYGIEKPQLLNLYEGLFNKQAKMYLSYDKMINLIVEEFSDVK